MPDMLIMQERWWYSKHQVVKTFIKGNTGLLLVMVAQLFFAVMDVSVKQLHSLDEPVPTLEVRLLPWDCIYVFAVDVVDKSSLYSCEWWAVEFTVDSSVPLNTDDVILEHDLYFVHDLYVRLSIFLLKTLSLMCRTKGGLALYQTHSWALKVSDFCLCFEESSGLF